MAGRSHGPIVATGVELGVMLKRAPRNAFEPSVSRGGLVDSNRPGCVGLLNARQLVASSVHDSIALPVLLNGTRPRQGLLPRTNHLTRAALRAPSRAAAERKRALSSPSTGGLLRCPFAELAPTYLDA